MNELRKIQKRLMSFLGSMVLAFAISSGSLASYPVIPFALSKVKLNDGSSDLISEVSIDTMSSGKQLSGRTFNK